MVRLECMFICINRINYCCHSVLNVHVSCARLRPDFLHLVVSFGSSSSFQHDRSNVHIRHRPLRMNSLQMLTVFGKYSNLPKWELEHLENKFRFNFKSDLKTEIFTYISTSFFPYFRYPQYPNSISLSFQQMSYGDSIEVPACPANEK